MVGRGWFWSQNPNKYNALMEKAKRHLLAEAPVGSGVGQVIKVLKKQDFSQTEWQVDGDGVLRAYYIERLDDLTCMTGPASWDRTLLQIRRGQAEERFVSDEADRALTPLA